MRFSVLAIDYDGTIAEHGQLNSKVRAALADVRRHGIYVVLVTGRILRDLHKLIGDLRLFDGIVAENGAVIAFPASGRTSILGKAPPAAFTEKISQLGINSQTGLCVVEADASAAGQILPVIREMELPLVILFNRGRLMVLPQAISKATGLRELLLALRLSPHNTMAIGDAENDHELLSLCELGVAVDWGSPTLKAAADMILPGAGPEAVADYIKRAAEHSRLPIERVSRRHLLLGQQEEGSSLALAIKGRNILVSGDPKSGKSWITGLLAEQLILQRYSVFVIDPEGDYASLEALPGVMVFGGEGSRPRLTELSRVLHHHDVSIVADLSGFPFDDKRRYVNLLLHLLATHRRRTGLPHRIVVDEAHYFLHDQDVLKLIDLEAGGYILVTYKASLLRPEILTASGALVVTRETDYTEIEALFRLHGSRGTLKQWEDLLKNLALDEAVLLPNAEESCGQLCRFKIAPRLTSHVRHRHKYFDVPVTDESAFIFTGGSGSTKDRARTLKEFTAVLERLPEEVMTYHLRRSDFSRWVEDVFGDFALAKSIRELEEQYRLNQHLYVREAIIERIEKRYVLEDNLFNSTVGAERVSV